MSGGKAEGVRFLAAQLGQPRSTVSEDCHWLAATGPGVLCGGELVFSPDEILAGRPRDLAEALPLPVAPVIAAMLRRHSIWRPATLSMYGARSAAFSLRTKSAAHSERSATPLMLRTVSNARIFGMALDFKENPAAPKASAQDGARHGQTGPAVRRLQFGTGGFVPQGLREICGDRCCIVVHSRADLATGVLLTY